MTQLTATFTVTIKTKPDGDYYFDHDDLVRNVVPWIEGGLDDRDDIAEVTITEQATEEAHAELRHARAALARIRDAARLRRQQLLGTSELYAVIEADDEQQPAGQTTPSHRAGLRDHIAGVLWPLTDWDGDELNAERAADAVLAVLYREWPWLRAEAEDAAPPADQATVYREAADALGCMDYDTDSNDYGYDTYRDAWNGGVMDAADRLRRMADETATEHRPAVSRWRVETLDNLANEWAPGTGWPVRALAVERFDAMNAKAPRWKDGTPVTRRLVRETTTYTVEAEHQPAAGARQDGAET